MAVTALIIFFFSRDSIKMRLLAALLIGTTWPLSFPVALIFLFF
nr:GhoT/OrtT family toxin [Enterobacillus tribolii]